MISPLTEEALSAAIAQAHKDGGAFAVRYTLQALLDLPPGTDLRGAIRDIVAGMIAAELLGRHPLDPPPSPKKAG